MVGINIPQTLHSLCVIILQRKLKTLLSPKSDQHLFSPNNVNVFNKVLRRWQKLWSRGRSKNLAPRAQVVNAKRASYMYQGGLGACPLENFEILVLKTHLDGTINAYNHRTQLAYVKTFEHPHAHNFYLTSTMCCMNVASLIYMTQSVVKSQRMLVVHDSCTQKSFRLNWPLKCISRILQQKLECLNRTQTSLNFGFLGVISKEK